MNHPKWVLTVSGTRSSFSKGEASSFMHAFVSTKTRVSFRNEGMFCYHSRIDIWLVSSYVGSLAVPQVPLGPYRHVGIEFLLKKDPPYRMDYPTVKDWSQKGEGFLNGLISSTNLLQEHKYVTRTQLGWNVLCNSCRVLYLCSLFFPGVSLHFFLETKKF
jgi:hypothetical protein